MDVKLSDEQEFVKGTALIADLVYIISNVKSLGEKGIDHSALIGLYKGNWGGAFNTTWRSTAIAVARVPTVKIVLIGEDGDVSTYAGGKREEESISPPPVMIRNARAIRGEVYACGSKRQVFRRTADQKWVDISAPQAKQTESLGFEALDGFDHDDIYAAGWAGEIWHYDGASWNQCKSPVKTILTSLCCAADANVYVAGTGGVLIRGKKDTWSQLMLDDVTEDLWDVCWFQDRLYVATMMGLFTLQGNQLQAVDLGDIGLDPVTCYSLSTAEGVLWSVGKSDVLSFDGAKWTRYN